MIDDQGGNVTKLPTAKRPKPDAAFEIVHSYKCQHGKFLVDEKKAEVECGLCHEKLNPIWVLLALAREDARLRDHWSQMKAELALMGERVRTKCDNCGKITRIHSNVRAMDRDSLAAKFRNGESA